MRRFLLGSFVALGMLAVFSARANGAGISVDAGLTAAEDRWILRNQVRYMQRKSDPSQTDRKMSGYAFPFVVAYGLRPDLTLMLRQTVMHQEMSMMGTSEKNTGFSDLFILAKYRTYRRNTAKYILGIAPTLGLEFPSGSDSFSSETWDLNPGLSISGRKGPWALDFNTAYTWNGLAGKGKNNSDPGDELLFNVAFTHQFSIGEKAAISLAPVLELTYQHIWPDQLDKQDISNTGESVLYLSPGIKFTISSFILEALLQIPVEQHQEGSQLERGFKIIVGTRFMF